MNHSQQIGYHANNERFDFEDCEIPNFANVYLGKVTQFQGYGLFRFGVLCNLLIGGGKHNLPPL